MFVYSVVTAHCSFTHCCVQLCCIDDDADAQAGAGQECGADAAGRRHQLGSQEDPQLSGEDVHAALGTKFTTLYFGVDVSSV